MTTDFLQEQCALPAVLADARVKNIKMSIDIYRKLVYYLTIALVQR